MTKHKNRPAPTTLAPDQYLDAARRERLREYARTQARKLDSQRARTDELLVELMLGSGLRAQEVCDLTLADTPAVHRSACVYVRHGKGDKARRVDINGRLAVRIVRYARQFRDGAAEADPLFLGCHGRKLRYHVLYDKAKRLGRLAGVELHPHSLRHSYAVWLYEQEHDILNVQKQLGHADLETTMVYARTCDGASRRQASTMI
jgi:integrase